MRRSRGKAWCGRLVLVVVIGTLSPGASAGDAAESAEAPGGFTALIRNVGRALGMAFRDIGQEGKRVGLAIGHGAASIGKEVGKGAATAGKEIGQAAKEGGQAFGRAIRGKGSEDKAPADTESVDKSTAGKEKISKEAI